MTKVLLTGYKRLDFSPKDDPGKRIKGFSLYLASSPDPDSGIVGFVPVSDGGKRFLNDSVCQKLGIDEQFLSDYLNQPLYMDVDFNGRIISCSPS